MGSLRRAYRFRRVHSDSPGFTRARCLVHYSSRGFTQVRLGVSGFILVLLCSLSAPSARLVHSGLRVFTRTRLGVAGSRGFTRTRLGVAWFIRYRVGSLLRA